MDRYLTDCQRGRACRAARLGPRQPFLLEAIARDALGDEGAAASALERALDVAEPDGVLLWFVLHPVPGLLERHAWQHTAHAALIADILSLLAGRRPARRRPGRGRRWSR